MKQKYVITNGENKNELLIKEMAELDKGILSVVFEEALDLAQIKAAMKADRAAVVSAIRTPGFYPIDPCATKIAEGVEQFVKAGDMESLEVTFDDAEFLLSELEAQAKAEKEAVEIEDLLKDDVEDDNYIEDENEIDAISSSSTSLKVADDDSIAPEDDDQ
jgi:hypothetical protein